MERPNMELTGAVKAVSRTASKILRAYSKSQTRPQKSPTAVDLIIDLVTDLFHLCDSENVSVQFVIDRAHSNWTSERNARR